MEAISHLTKGLELLKTLPDTPERTQQELTLQIAWAGADGHSRAMAAPEVEQAYTRARELCQQVGETPQLFPVLWGLCDFIVMRAELADGAVSWESRLLAWPRATRPRALLQAHYALGMTVLRSESSSSPEHLEQGIALYDPQQHRSHVLSLWRA